MQPSRIFESVEEVLPLERSERLKGATANV